MKRKGLWRDKETQCLAKERMKRGLKTKKKKLCYTQMKQTPPVTYKITEQRRHFLSLKKYQSVSWMFIFFPFEFGTDYWIFANLKLNEYD